MFSAIPIWIQIVGWVIMNAPSLISAVIQVIHLVRGAPQALHTQILQDIGDAMKVARETGSADQLKSTVEQYAKNK